VPRERTFANGDARSRNQNKRQKPSSSHARVLLSTRLRTRQGEIEDAVLSRVHAISEPTANFDPEYLEGLRAAVSAALDYGLAATERGEERAPHVPTALLSQARMAARAGVNLDTVLRRYCAGHALLNDYIVEEIEEDAALATMGMKGLLRTQAILLDRLLAGVSEEYSHEFQRRLTDSELRRVDRVRRLLAGELLDTSGLAYDFDAFHIGVIASGPRAARTIRDIASSLDRRLLVIQPSEETAWAWFGTHRPVDTSELERHFLSKITVPLSVAIGEPAQALLGWRLTHRQACAALPIALRSPDDVVRYADIPLLASTYHDDLLATSLHKLFLAPLEQERDGGKAARETLRAYFTTNGNISSTAVVLAVSRPTITTRLRTIEGKIDRPIDSARAEIELALNLQDLGVIPLDGES